MLTKSWPNFLLKLQKNRILGWSVQKYRENFRKILIFGQKVFLHTDEKSKVFLHRCPHLLPPKSLWYVVVISWRRRRRDKFLATYALDILYFFGPEGGG